MSKRDYGNFVGDDDEEIYKDHDDVGKDRGPSAYEKERKKLTYEDMLHSMFGSRVDKEGFNYNDASSMGGTSNHEDEDDGFKQPGSKKQKTNNNNNNNRRPPKPPARPPANRADDDASNIEVEEEEEGERANVGGNTKNEQQKRFFGFKGKEFLRTMTLNGNKITPDEDEKRHLDIVLKKLNSKNQDERKEAQGMLKDKTHMNKSVKASMCRICEIVCTDNFSFMNFSTMLNPLESMQKADLNSTGYVQPIQLFEQLKDKFNEQEAMKSSGREVKALFTVDEVANCYNNHNKMNLKRIIYNNLQCVGELKEECLMNVKGSTSDGQSIFLDNTAKAAVFFMEKEIAFAKELAQADLFYFRIGALKAIHAQKVGGRGGDNKLGNRGGGSAYSKVAGVGTFKDAILKG